MPKLMVNFLLDVSHSMSETLPNSGSSSSSSSSLSTTSSSTSPTKLDMAINTISTQILAEQLRSKTSEFCLQTYGDKTTHNYLNETQGGYEYVNEIFPMGTTDASTLPKIHAIKASDNSIPSGDIIDGFAVALDIFLRVNPKLKRNRILILVTDAESKVDLDGLDDLGKILNSMISSDVVVHILVMGRVNSDSSVVKTENMKLLKDVASKTGGSIMEANSHSEAIVFFADKGIGVSPALAKFNLEIGPQLTIPVKVWGKAQANKFPTLSRHVIQSETVNEMDVDDSNNYDAVKLETIYRDVTRPDEEISPVNLIHAYKYGQQYIPLNSNEMEALKLSNTPNTITILGFVSTQKVPRHFYLSPTSVLQGDVQVEHSNLVYSKESELPHSIRVQLSITALSRAMRELGQVALVKRVKREESGPSLMVLSPPPTGDDGTLLLHQVPFADDVNNFLFPSLGSGNSSHHQQLVSNMVDAMTIDPTRRRITPYDPALRSVLGAIEKKCIPNPEHVLPYPDPFFGAPWQDHDREKQILDSIKCVMDTFKLKKRDTSSSSKRKVYWSEIKIEGESSSSSESVIPDADKKTIKMAKTESQGEGGSTATTAVPTVKTEVKIKEEGVNEAKSSSSSHDIKVESVPQFTLGSTNPINDFKAVLLHEAASENDISNACQTMMTMIEQAIVRGRSTVHYRKAIDYLSVLREHAITYNQVAAYNAFMINVMKPLGADERYLEMWELLKTTGLSLISNTEASNSDISEAEKTAYFKPAEAEVSIPAADVAVDDDFVMD